MLALVVAALACYAMTLAPMTWVILSEVFPSRVRGTAMAVATASLWAACFVLTYTLPLLNASLGTVGTFWVFGKTDAEGVGEHEVQDADGESGPEDAGGRAEGCVAGVEEGL